MGPGHPELGLGGGRERCDDAKVRAGAACGPIAVVGPNGLLAAQAGGDPQRGSRPIRREAADPAYPVHLLGTETAVDHMSDPPAAPTHQRGPAASPVLDWPQGRPMHAGVPESAAATAWTATRTGTTVHADAVPRFIDERASQGTGG